MYKIIYDWFYYSTIRLLSGPVAGMLTDRFEHRPVIICGALLASTGALLSAFATELWMLYITYGVMGGKIVPLN